MPFVANTAVLNSFDVGTGNREDLLDIITNISPMDTLFLSGFEKVPANNISHEWLVDILAAFGDVDVGNADVQATPEGSDATFDPLVPRKRLCNLTHIIRRTFDVSDTQRDINTAGIRDEYVYQLRKATMELARFIEFALVHSERQSQTAQGNSGGVLPRKMDGYYAFAAASDPTCATTLGLGERAAEAFAVQPDAEPQQQRPLQHSRQRADGHQHGRLLPVRLRHAADLPAPLSAERSHLDGGGQQAPHRRAAAGAGRGAREDRQLDEGHGGVGGHARGARAQRHRLHRRAVHRRQRVPVMAERVCSRCNAPVRVERSAVRLTVRCTNTSCKHVVVKNVVKKGYG
jgi:hypothetical protein